MKEKKNYERTKGYQAKIIYEKKAKCKTASIENLEEKWKSFIYESCVRGEKAIPTYILF